MNLEGKKILITGASSGIGRAAAIQISEMGGKVILNGRNEERLNRTLAKMTGDGHHVMPFDMRNLDGIKQYVKDCVQVDDLRFDGMVFSTGIPGGKPIRIEDMGFLREMMEVSFYSYFSLLKEFSSRRIMNDGGSIVAVTSSCVHMPDKSQGSYASSKAAADVVSKVAAKELSKRKIRVNTVRPIITNTPMTTDFFSMTPKEEQEEMFPLGPLVPEDIAGPILFLLSDMSAKITGQYIYVSGGFDGTSMDYYNVL